MNIWHDINPTRITPEHFTTVIEISKGGKNKYELDKETGMLCLDRVLYTSTHYPANYGFIPLTYADDKDPLDVLLICQETIQPMTLVECAPIGIIYMTDGSSTDEKIIAVPVRDPAYSSYQDISELPAHIFNEFTNFFEVYKTLEGVTTHVEEAKGREEALRVINECIDRYRNHFIGRYRDN